MSEVNPNLETPKTPGTPKKGFKFNPYWLYAIVAVALIGISYFNGSTATPEELPYSIFEKRILNGGDVKKLVVIREEVKAEIVLEKAAIEKYKDLFKSGQDIKSFKEDAPQFYVSLPSLDKFEESRQRAEKELGKEVPVIYSDGGGLFMQFLIGYGPLLLIFGLTFYFIRRMSNQAGGGGAGGIFSVGKSKAKMFDKESSTQVSFKDVAGLAEAKQELVEIVEFLRRPEKYTELGGKIPKGALLVGPPGTGKTLLAKAVAGEANVPFFSMSGSDFVEMFVGVGASRVRDLFKRAKEKAPCIIFIDEIDAIGRARGKNPNMGANDERENTLNQLLTEMDGFASNSGVIILAATNRADILDRALMRAGRFDRQIQVELPDLNERQEIFEVHLKPLKLGDDVKSDFLARQTPGFSGADIANVCNESALIAARHDKKMIEKDDFLSAVDRIVGGLEKKNKIITKEEKKAIAYHESGHATISWLLEHAHPLIKLTIVPRGKALGAAWYLPEERQLTTTQQILDEMCSALGGRAAEEIFFGRISTGALNDLEKVTKQAYAMVTYFGMSEKIGNRSFYDSSGQNEYAFNKPYSEKTAEIIDQEVSDMIASQYARAKQTLEDNRDKMVALADMLLEREVIFAEDLEIVFGKRQLSHHVIEEENGNTKVEEVAPSTDETIA